MSAHALSDGETERIVRLFTAHGEIEIRPANSDVPGWVIRVGDTEAHGVTLQDALAVAERIPTESETH